jgi:hypothetical protein
MAELGTPPSRCRQGFGGSYDAGDLRRATVGMSSGMTSEGFSSLSEQDF